MLFFQTPQARGMIGVYDIQVPKPATNSGYAFVASAIISARAYHLGLGNESRIRMVTNMSSCTS